MVKWGFNGVHMAPEEGACCEWEKRGYHLGAVRKTQMYIFNAHVFSFRGLGGGGYILSVLSSGS